MTRHLIALATLSLIASACGTTATTETRFPEEVWSDAASAKTGSAKTQKSATKAALAREEADAPPATRGRKVGDFFVHRFTGSFRKNPVTLTEEVVAHEGQLLIVDYTFEDNDQSVSLRARINTDTNGVVRVSKMEKDREVEMSLAAYEALIDETVYAPDSNEGEIASEKVTCLVGTEQHDCESKTYRVMIGDKPAKLTVTSTSALPGRDVSGEITGADGKLIYRAEIVEMGNTAGQSGSVAASE